MARPRTPTRILELKGAFRKHPERRRPGEPKPTGPIGDPPEHLSDAEKALWYEIVGNLPSGVAANCDRLAMEIMAKLMLRFRAEEDCPLAVVERLDRLLDRFGMNPSGRARLNLPVRKEEDPLKEFITARPKEEAVQ